jgi:hypothetical protein
MPQGIFRLCFTAPVWNHILVLVGGAILAPGERTVTQTLRVMGLADQLGFGRYPDAQPNTLGAWRGALHCISRRGCRPAARW